jgi:hypothetical protein
MSAMISMPPRSTCARKTATAASTASAARMPWPVPSAIISMGPVAVAA